MDSSPCVLRPNRSVVLDLRGGGRETDSDRQREIAREQGKGRGEGGGRDSGALSQIMKEDRQGQSQTLYDRRRG